MGQAFNEWILYSSLETKSNKSKRQKLRTKLRKKVKEIKTYENSLRI